MEISVIVKNIGPIVDTGCLSLSRFNIIIGKQSTGKSTLMKIVSYCQWLEKKLMTDSDNEILYNYTHYYRFRKELSQFHRLNDSFFTRESYIEYESESIKIISIGNKGNAVIIKKSNFTSLCHNTKLCFIPSERNLVSAIRNVERSYRASENDLIFNHIFEWAKAKEKVSEKSPVDLSVVGNMEYFYDSEKEADFVVLRESHRKISPFYASSGVQSVLPIVVMIKYLTSPDIYDTLDMTQFDVSTLMKSLSEKKSDEASIKKIFEQFSARQRYKNTKLFVEEPEQNLFPESQQALVNLMVDQINAASDYTKESSTLTITTHSPYIITAFNVLMRAAQAMEINETATNAIIPTSRAISYNEIKAYYVREDGTIDNILDQEMNMISGVDLDNASTIVEDQLSLLNDIIYE